MKLSGNFLALIVCSALYCCFSQSVWADAIQLSSESSDGSSLDPAGIFDPSNLQHGFLFTGNTMYDYSGFLELEIILAEMNPSETSSLAGVQTQVADITLTPGSGAAAPELLGGQISTTEPRTFAPLALMLICGAGVRLRRRDHARESAGSATLSLAPPPPETDLEILRE